MKKNLIKLIRSALVLCVLFLGITLFLEFIYRNQLIDLYQPELRAYNNQDDLAPTATKARTILVLGDSFSAGLHNNYVAKLREADLSYRVINSAVGGSGSVQASIVAPHRLQSFDPDILIYQIYVGNDLFDIRYSSNINRTGLFRWAYWKLGSHIRFISWLNYRLGQIQASNEASPAAYNDLSIINPPMTMTNTGKRFSPALYTERQKIMLAAEPSLIDHTVMLNGARSKDFETLIENLYMILSLCFPGKCDAYVLIVPHKVQVSPTYLQDYQQLGIQVRDHAALARVDYPFIVELENRLAKLKNVKLLNPLLQAKQLESTGARLYFSNDEHMNLEGQNLLFRTIINQMKIDGLLR